MKTIICTVAILAVLFSSCAKNTASLPVSIDSTAVGTIFVDINGDNHHAFTISAIAHSYSVLGYTNLVISGREQSGDSINIGLLGYNSLADIIPGTYVDSTGAFLSLNHISPYYGNVFFHPDALTHDTSFVTVTAISPTEIQGTFSGRIVNDGNVNIVTENLSLANGKFHVVIQ